MTSVVPVVLLAALALFVAWVAHKAVIDLEFAIKRQRRELVEKAKSIYRELHSGGCRMLSEGDECQCFLCRMDEEGSQ